MKGVLTAVYNALSTDTLILQRLTVDQIKRGWQDPMNYPGIRFYSSGTQSKTGFPADYLVLMETITVSVLGFADLDVEEIADAVQYALSIEQLSANGVVFHSSEYRGDTRGTWFDESQNAFRKDLKFKILYSNLIN